MVSPDSTKTGLHMLPGGTVVDLNKLVIVQSPEKTDHELDNWNFSYYLENTAHTHWKCYNDSEAKCVEARDALIEAWADWRVAQSSNK